MKESKTTAKNLSFSLFANCQKIDGGEECIQDIPAGQNCLNNMDVLNRY